MTVDGENFNSDRAVTLVLKTQGLTVEEQTRDYFSSEENKFINVTKELKYSLVWP